MTVEVRTSTFVAFDATALLTYKVRNGATVSFTSDPSGQPGYVRDAGDVHGNWCWRPSGLRLPVPVHAGRRHADRVEHDQHVRDGRARRSAAATPSLVDVSIGSPPAVAGSASTTYQIDYPSLTAVSLGASPAAAAAFGAPVVFTASGVVPAGLPAGAVYYRFMNGAAVLQDWSTSATFTSSALALGTYSVTVEASTAASGWTAQATSAAVAYEIYTPASVIIGAGSPASPQVYGTTVTFTAVGSGGPTGATYQYRFRLDGGTFGAWGPSAIYTFPMDGVTLGGTRTVTVEILVGSNAGDRGNGDVGGLRRHVSCSDRGDARQRQPCQPAGAGDCHHLDRCWLVHCRAAAQRVPVSVHGVQRDELVDRTRLVVQLTVDLDSGR